MTGLAGGGDAGLGWQVDSDQLVLVVSAASAGLRRELGPTAWSVFETLVLAARPTVVGELVACANAREIAAAVGVGRDAATKALALLRERALIAIEQRRRDGGQFCAARHAIRVERVGEAPRTTRRARAISARQRVATPTLFDTPTIDPHSRDHDDQRDIQRSADAATTTNSPGHSRPSSPESREEPHTLALRMPEAAGPPGGVGLEHRRTSGWWYRLLLRARARRRGLTRSVTAKQ